MKLNAKFLGKVNIFNDYIEQSSLYHEKTTTTKKYRFKYNFTYNNKR